MIFGNTSRFGTENDEPTSLTLHFVTLHIVPVLKVCS